MLKYFLSYQQKKLREFEKHSCALFETCITVSDFDNDYLSNFCDGGSFLTVPNGVDCEFFALNGEIATPKTLVWTGSMSGPYNRDAVIYFARSIWPLIERDLPDTRVFFVGSEPPPEISGLAKMNPNVKVTGYVDDVRPFVAQGSVFIAPLRAGSGTKIKVLNAMAQGKAVVTTSVGAEGIDARDTLEILLADTPEVFADRTLHLLNNPHEANEIGLRARKLMEKKYDWKVVNRRMTDLYDSLVCATG